MTDEQFFATHPDRLARIRLPGRELYKDRQRHVQYHSECENEFRSLGPHDSIRRRIILWRVPRDNPWYDPDKPAILKIPFLAFASETIEDRDDILLPIIHKIMTDAAARIA